MAGSRSAADGSEAGLARTRVEFLTVGGPGDAPLGGGGAVRDSILASWWRSRHSNVAADRTEPAYVRDPDLDSPLIRSAEPVLRHLHEQLGGQPLAIVLTDTSGVVLTRLTCDDALERHLDRVRLAPGFSYAEEMVGTNGIGTALEAGRPMHVFGHEHYAENLEQLACAGVPIRHPVTGKTVGALDLTCWRRDAGALLMTLAKTTAEQIRQSLLLDAGVRELELMQAYLRACHRSSGMVFALDDDVVMMNDKARSELSPEDQEALLQSAALALAGSREATTLELPTGARVRVHTSRVRGEAGPAGGVVEVRVESPGRAGPPPGDDPVPRMLLPGLVGSGPLWRRACTEAETAQRAGEWLVLEGEQATGKLALLRALHQRAAAGSRFAVVDGADSGERSWLGQVRETLATADGTVVVRHLEGVSPVALRSLRAALEETSARSRAWVAACARVGEPGEELAALLRLFPRTVPVPPLRHHAEDVRQLVPFLLRRLGHPRLTCSPETVQLLLRAQWPGNVEQLLQVLRSAARARRAGVLQPADLPPEIGVVSRRLLTPLESMERDAIVLGLVDAHGNKAEAARGLGISRATIYRKIHDYGIVTSP